MNENITITAEQIAEIKAMLKQADKRYDRTNDAQLKKVYGGEAITLERVLDILGIQY